jgi:hypothetical protein
MLRKSVLGLLALGAAVGIQHWGALTPSSSAAPAGSSVDKSFLLEEEPEKATDVIGARKQSKDQEEIVVVGRIGGRVNPWVKGMAAFSIVDRTLRPCNEIPGDNCKTPWDYCCAAGLSKATLLVMVADQDGKVVKKDARQLLGVKELDTVTLVGKARRDKAGNVSILASKLYVAKPGNKDAKKQ